MSCTQQSYSSLRERAFDILEHGRRRDAASRVLDWIIVVLIVANVGGTVAQTVPEIEAQYGTDLQLFDRMDAATRASRAPRQEARAS